jgi:hypothetical protein
VLFLQFPPPGHSFSERLVGYLKQFSEFRGRKCCLSAALVNSGFGDSKETLLRNIREVSDLWL